MEERRTDVSLIRRIGKLEENHFILSQKIDANTATTNAIKESTDELLELFKTAKGGLKTVTWIGRGVKGIASIAAACIGLYLAWKQWLG